MAQLRKENEELSMIVNESVELAEMYKAELLQMKDQKESDDEKTSKGVFLFFSENFFESA